MNPLISKWTGFNQVEDLLKTYPEDDPLAFLNKCNHLYGIECESYNLPQSIAPSTIFLSTHHTGALDFLTIYSNLASKVPHLKIVMNNQLFKINHLRSIAIGVHTLSTGKKNPEGNNEMTEHLRKGGSLLVFPAGKVGFKQGNEIQDFPWRIGIGKIALKEASQIIPIYVQAENSKIFYHIRRYLPKLSMLFLLRALKSRKREVVKIFYGTPIETKENINLSAEDLINLARKQAYELPTLNNRPGDRLENN